MSTSAFKAAYLDGRSANKKFVTIEFVPAALFISDMGETWRFKDIEVEVIRADEIYVFADKSKTRRLEVNDTAAVERILHLTKIEFFDYGSDVGKKIIAATFVIAALAVLFWQLSPKVAKSLAQKVPTAIELKLRPYIHKELEKNICNNPKAVRSFVKILDFLQAGEPEIYPAEIFFGSSKIVNAFAFPGGIIVIEQGLLSKTKSQEALVGIVAHELQHLKQRHILAAVIRSSLLTLMWKAAFGDFSGLLAIDPSTLYQVASLKFSRNDEAEADQKGAEMMAAKGVAVLPLINFLEHDLGSPSSEALEFVSSHPLRERGLPLRNQFGEVKTSQLPLTPQEWQELKAAKCQFAQGTRSK